MLFLLLAADVFYVSPGGNDANDGRSPAKAWRSVAKVNATPFQPGDSILFARGGEWRESLKASSSGTPGKPITFAAYGEGPKPRFWGSDVLKHADFRSAAGGRFSIAVAAPVAAVLADHVFLPPTAWEWKAGTLSVDRDPRADTRVWTACVRVDLVHSNGRNHLVFRDLVADESADARDGYGFRVMGSDGVRLESCEAYRAGRHHFGVINSTNFAGEKLHCAVAMPACPGGATFYVSFSDASRKGDTHRWIDCSAEGFENPGQRNYQVFYDHGEGLGPILIRNLRSKGGKFSVAGSKAAPVTIEGGLIEDNSLEVFGEHLRVDGLTIRGDGALDLFGSDGLYENLLLVLAPKNGGPTGYGSAVVVRDGAKRNTLRFSTVILDGESCLTLAARGLETRWYGNVLASRKAGAAGAGDAALADFNFYTGPDLAAWKAKGLDANSLGGDPSLTADHAPKPGSPLMGAARIDPSMRPARDLAGAKRPAACSIGALEPRP